MKAIGFIPLRKGSKGIPGKNRKMLLGKPLYQWVLDEAIKSRLDHIYVFTDDDDLLKELSKYSEKVTAVKRSVESATDTASTEQAIMEFINSTTLSFDVFCLLQATSPFTQATDINNALRKLKEENTDSVVSVVRTHRFIWNDDGTPQNYDIHKRPRRQDFEGLLIENGAIYVTRKSSLKQSKNRISGKISLVEMSEISFVEIDTLSDWTIVEALLNNEIELS